MNIETLRKLYSERACKNIIVYLREMRGYHIQAKNESVKLSDRLGSDYWAEIEITHETYRVYCHVYGAEGLKNNYDERKETVICGCNVDDNVDGPALAAKIAIAENKLQDRVKKMWLELTALLRGSSITRQALLDSLGPPPC